MAEPKYPHVHVRLTGEYGNAAYIIARTAGAMRRANISAAAVDAYTDEAARGDYLHAISVTEKTVSTS